MLSLSKKGLTCLVVFCFLSTIIYHHNRKKCYIPPATPMMLSPDAIQQVSEIQITTERILNQMDQRIRRVNFVDKTNTTSAQHSKVYLKDPKNSYCVGDRLTVQVDMFDYLGKKKTYGGDFLRARISTPELEAGSSGRIEDLNNGSYRVHFILFWEGSVTINVFLMHPSEVASALWTFRNQWHGYVDHMGKYVTPQQQREVICGFHLDKKGELCEYTDQRDEEYFYCVKPQNFSCDSLSKVKSWWRHDKTLFTTDQMSLLDKSNIRVRIPTDFHHINVSHCNNSHISITKTCKIGMKLEYPSGYAMKDVWYPKSCRMLTYKRLEEVGTCLQGKFIHMFGDSTVKLWYDYMGQKIKSLKPFHLYEDNWSQQLLNLDLERNMKISWKRHTFPFITTTYQSWKEERTITREIDLIRGDNRTVIILSIGVHFRAYPLYYFIKRLHNIRRAIERLLIRSPETKVIIKTENTGEMDKNFETMSDFHAAMHYSVMEIVFNGLNVGFVNGWDMTNAFDTNKIHPAEKFYGNEVKMLMTYIC
ncbi:NXPE family member 4-like isoform X2 [Engystomops pustulosus]|uniref:NXPE family member 4-like isoform X2 n=1 Tax=Engystomops pustulosus TaxID=76066 RepID=UPI003AFABF40